MRKIIFCLFALAALPMGCGDDDGESSPDCDDGVQRTMGCEEGVKTQECKDGEWTDITECGNETGPDFVCKAGDEKTILCQDGTGIQEMVCENNAWTTAGDCITVKCTEGAKQSIPCPDDPEKEVVQTCQDGDWVLTGTCEYPGAVCTEDEEIEVECGLDGNQTQKMKCVKGQWTFEGSCVTTGCIDGESKEVSCGSSYDMVQRKKCIDGSWQDLGGCVAPIEMGSLVLQRRVINDSEGVAQIRLLMEFEGANLRSSEIQIRNSNNGQWLPVIIESLDPTTFLTKRIITTIQNLDLIALIVAVQSYNDEAALATLPAETNVIYWDYFEVDGRNRVTQYATRNGVGEIIFRGSYTYDETYLESLRTATLSFVDGAELWDYVDPSLEPLLGNMGYFALRGNELFFGTDQKVTANLEFLFNDATGPVTEYVNSYYGAFFLNRDKTIRHVSTKGSLLSEKKFMLAGDGTTVLPVRDFENHSGQFSDDNYEYTGDAIITRTIKDKKARVLKKVSYTYDANGNLTGEDCTSTSASSSRCVTSFEGDPVDNYAIVKTYDTEGLLASSAKTIDHDDSAETDPVTLEEWIYTTGNPTSAYTHVPRTFCAITIKYPWDREFVVNSTTCSAGPSGGDVTYEMWNYDENGRIVKKRGYVSKDDAVEGEGDNPLYTQTIDYTGADLLKPTKVTYMDNFSAPDASKENFADVFNFEYLENDWVSVGKYEEYNDAIPPEEAGYCTDEAIDTIMTAAECTDKNCLDLDENGVFNGTECGCDAETEPTCTDAAEDVCVAIAADGVLTVAECDPALCSDDDGNGFININTECDTLYDETKTSELVYERLYKKQMDGDVQTGLELRNEGVFWLAFDLDAQGNIIKWMSKEPATGAMQIEKTINPLYAPYVEMFSEPWGDWEMPVVLDAKRYNDAGTVVEEYQVDATTGWPLRMACTEECDDLSMIDYEFLYSKGNAPEWFLHSLLPFDVGFDQMEETYVFNLTDSTAAITLKISEGEDDLKTVWQKTTKRYIVFDPNYGNVPILFPTHNTMEFAEAVSVPYFWNEAGELQSGNKAHYSNKEQTYDEETGTVSITNWTVKYNDDAEAEIEHTLVSSEFDDGVLTKWTCDYFQCYLGDECTRATAADLAGRFDVPCNNATMEVTSDDSTFVETHQVRDRTDRIWSETTIDYVDDAKTNYSALTNRERLQTAFEEEGNEDTQFETTLRQVYEEVGGNWLITEYYELVDDGIAWEKFYYDSNAYISKKEFLEANGQVATWHDYINTYMSGSNVILNTVIKDEYGTPLGSIDYFWMNP